MSARRDFLAMTVGAVAARAVLPGVARSAPAHPDADLIRICAEHIANLHAYNRDGGDLESDDDLLWHAYARTRDFVSNAKLRTLEGMVAKAQAAKAEAVRLDGSDSPDGTIGAIWAWDIVTELCTLGNVTMPPRH